MTATVRIRIDTWGIDKKPHTFLVVTEPDGETKEYGMGPVKTKLIGDGRIYYTGMPPYERDGAMTEHLEHEYNFESQKQQISDTQYNLLIKYINESIKDPPDYIVTGTESGSNCTEWVVNAWNAAGIPNQFGITNKWVWNPYHQAINIKIAVIHDAASDLFQEAIWNRLMALDNYTSIKLDDVITDINHSFVQAETTRSPLVIDLNGDGVRTTRLSAGIYFDNDGNGFSELTGWIDCNDGLLVVDRNDNGRIDDGTELFGNYTILSDSTKAANGFWLLRITTPMATG